MTYYEVSKPTMTVYTVDVSAYTYYTVPNISTVYYQASIIAIRTWKSLADQGAKTWSQLKDLGLTTWEKLGAAKGGITFFYEVSNPTTTYYEVT